MMEGTATITKLQYQPHDSIADENMNIKSSFSTNKVIKQEYKSLIGTYGAELKWFNITYLLISHLLGIWALIYFPYLQHLKLFAWTFMVGHLGGLGVTAGAHRLWTHRSYKANLPLRIFLMLCFTFSLQNSLYDWVRDHRVHHKYSETDADPHNMKRGFFFAHAGWLMMKKHPEVIRKGKQIDMSDISSDPVAAFHTRHTLKMKYIVGFLLPIIIPPLFWNESWFWSFIAAGAGRQVLNLNTTWCVNSLAHRYGGKPYDKNINPSDNIPVSIISFGEGSHNYHHTFPWDYRTAELGKYFFNVTTIWINMFAAIGWAYDLKIAPKDLVETVAKKHGDCSHFRRKYYM